MSIQHKDIPDAQLHEPKGIVSAPASTFYRSNGAGSGGWGKLKSSDLTGIAGDSGSSNLKFVSDGSNGFVTKTDAAYGAMLITTNTNAFAITAAVDGTLNTNTDYVLLTGTGAPWAADASNFNITFSTNRLTVPVTGVYKIDLWSTIISWPSASAKVSVKYRLNGGATYSVRHPMARAPSTATDPGELTGFGFIPLVANDFLQLYVASSVTGNLTFQDVNTSLTLIRQTA